MKLKAIGAIGFIALIGLTSLGIYTLLNMGDRGIQTMEKCELSCSSNVTTEGYEDFRAELKAENPDYNLSRTGEKIYCPCTNSTTLKYDIMHRGLEAGVLTHEDGDTEITITRRAEVGR